MHDECVAFVCSSYVALMMRCGAKTQALYIHDGAPHSRWIMYDGVVHHDGTSMVHGWQWDGVLVAIELGDVANSTR